MKKNNVCGIIVTYNPQEELSQNVLILSKQVDKIIIVDNTLSKEKDKLLLSLEKNKDVEIIYNYDNLGIATALNIGIKKAIKMKFEWVLTMDQDSKADKNMVSKLFEASKIFPDCCSFTPLHKEKFNKKDLNPKKLKFKEVFVDITSGNLLRTSVFDKVGFFVEELFIDGVDTEFFLRLQKQGYKTVKVFDSVLHHQLGEQNKPTKFLWRKNIFPTNHNYIRRYYITRNRMYLYKKYKFSNLEWFLFDFKAFLRETYLIIFAEKDKLRKLKSTLSGVYDGILGKMGKKNF